MRCVYVVVTTPAPVCTEVGGVGLMDSDPVTPAHNGAGAELRECFWPLVSSQCQMYFEIISCMLDSQTH